MDTMIQLAEVLAVVVDSYLEERDDRVLDALFDADRDLELQLHEANSDNNTYTVIMAERTRLRTAVRHGHWYKLSGYLSAADIESLCNCDAQYLRTCLEDMP